MGQALSGDRPGLAPRLGARRAVLRVSRLAIRKMIYTTNAVEALHRSLRKIIKTRGSFPNDDAALKLLYLAIKNAGIEVAARRRVDRRHGPVRHSVRLALSGIGAMTKVSISRLIRRPEFGRSASSVKAGLRPRLRRLRP